MYVGNLPKTKNNPFSLVAIPHDVTELNWHCLVFDELSNEQAVINYSRHRLTASVAYVTTTHSVAWARPFGH